MNHLNFICTDKCKQIYPYGELLRHKQRNLCRVGYIRNPETNVGKKKGIAQSEYTTGSG